MALNILKNFEFESDGRESAETCHRQLEAMKLAFADGTRYVADTKSMTVTAAELLSGSYGRMRSRLIGKTAGTPNAGDPRSGGTIYLCTADREGIWFPLSRAILTDSAPASSCRGREYPFRTGGAFTLDGKSENCLGPEKESVSYDNSGFP